MPTVGSFAIIRTVEPMFLKVASFVLTLVADVIIGVLILVFLLIAMNGFGERVATWGLAVYVILAVFISILSSTAAYFFSARMIARGKSAVMSVLLISGVCVAIGLVGEVISGFVGVVIAEIMRTKHW